MLTSLAFASPGLLGFLLALPLLWWLLRLTPPPPRKVVFPALRLLQGLAAKEETPARTPWWLLLLRLLICALVILALAQPVLNPLPAAQGSGALLIVIDNDWAAARDWPQRQEMLRDFIRQAERSGRDVFLLPTAPSSDGGALTVTGPIAAKAALAEIGRLAPQPWSADWKQAKDALEKSGRGGVAETLWLASGTGNTDAMLFFETLQKIGGTPHVYGTTAPIYTLMPPQDNGEGLALSVRRASTDDATELTIDAVARDGNVLARLPVHFAPGAPETAAPFNLPLDLRNAVARFEVEGMRSAATTALTDSGWEHRPVGIVGDRAELDRHSLLSSLYYIDRALEPYADIHVDNLAALLKQEVAVIIVPDTGALAGADTAALTAWVKKGGVLLRFADERLATAPADAANTDLLPVPLRSGDRVMGGVLSWATPQGLRAFPDGSPFRGLAVPRDVTVSRQVLAEPSADLPQRTWAALTDGTPLVTAKPIGAGESVLLHVPARSEWSNLPLSGLFVDMLRRIIDLSRCAPQQGAGYEHLAPLAALDGFGDEQKPGSAAQPLEAGEALPIAGPQHPPGLYGTGGFNRAFNLGPALGQPQALNIPMETPQTARGETDLMPWLLAAAFILLLGDFLISLRLRGVLSWRMREVG